MIRCNEILIIAMVIVGCTNEIEETRSITIDDCIELRDESPINYICTCEFEHAGVAYPLGYEFVGVDDAVYGKACSIMLFTYITGMYCEDCFAVRK